MLLAAHGGGGAISSASRGRERQLFVEAFLSQVLPVPFRFGTGDITDGSGVKTGEIDIVVEYPFGPSFPLLGAPSTRLYLAESVAAVIEVKSDLAAQWSQVKRSAAAVASITRRPDLAVQGDTIMPPRIPFFAVSPLGDNRRNLNRTSAR
jgi:hypothetical protein